MYSGEAGYFLSGAWFFLTLEADDMGEKINYCKYNVFADDAVKEDVRWNALGGYQTEAKYSVNSQPPCGLDTETVTYLGLEMEYWTRVSAGLEGNMTTVIGDFEFKGRRKCNLSGKGRWKQDRAGRSGKSGLYLTEDRCAAEQSDP